MDEETRNKDFRETPRYQAAVTFLFERINYERVTKMPYSKRDLNISRMRRLLELLGNPHDQLKIIHIAGTKGKGSTTAFMSSALVAFGLRCGSYTSPHLQHVEERFQIDGEPCTPEQLASLIETVRPAAETMDEGYEGGGPTYFEICTAIAFLLFVQQKVDVTILEVGLGGRLDSTNVCVPAVSVITNISFDHVKQLGNTLAKIAKEKAGIIKPSVPVISGATAPEAKRTIEETAAQNKSDLKQLEVDFTFDYRAPSAKQQGQATFVWNDGTSEPYTTKDVTLGLLGEHQAANASVAWAALRSLPDDIQPNDAAIKKGFAAARCAARIEVVSHEPEVIVDASHNVASSHALVDVLTTVYPDRRRILVIGATTGKDVAGMLKILLPSFEEVICTQYENNPRAYKAESLFRLASQTSENITPSPRSITCEPNPRQAWLAAKQISQPNDLICATGSFFIAAEIKNFIQLESD